jgi:hypothetical protein
MNCQPTFVATTFLQPYTHYQGALDREEAKSRLQKLIPGSPEYCKLQDLLMKTAGIVEVNLPDVVYKVDTSPKECRLLGGFGSSEHFAIGEEVKLNGLPENTPLLVK